MFFFRLFLLALLLLLSLGVPVTPARTLTSSRWSRRARLVLRGPQPVYYNGWMRMSPSVPSRSIPLSPGVTRICPIDFPSGFSVVCDPAYAGANKATFSVAGRVVKVATWSWFGPFVVAAHFRAGKVVWQRWATGNTVVCRLDNGENAKATIKVYC